MDIGTLLVVAAALFVFNLFSLLVPWEGVRGMGRVAYGLSTALLGVYIMVQPTPASVSYLFAYITWGFVGGGILVALLGYRKYRNRNNTVAAPAKKG